MENAFVKLDTFTTSLIWFFRLLTILCVHYLSTTLAQNEVCWWVRGIIKLCHHLWKFKTGKEIHFCMHIDYIFQATHQVSCQDVGPQSDILIFMCKGTLNITVSRESQHSQMGNNVRESFTQHPKQNSSIRQKWLFYIYHGMNKKLMLETSPIHTEALDLTVKCWKASIFSFRRCYSAQVSKHIAH